MKRFLLSIALSAVPLGIASNPAQALTNSRPSVPQAVAGHPHRVVSNFYWPGPRDATMRHGYYVKMMFACIRAHESHNQLRDGNYDINGYEGLYQFSPSTWDNAADVMRFRGGASVYANDASGLQQSAAAVVTWESAGFSPWSGDGCV